MPSSRLRMISASFLGLTAAALLVAGCGKSETADDATVNVPEPLPGATGGASSSGGGTSASTSPPAPSAPEAGGAAPAAVKAEGFGTLKGRVTFAGDPPAPKMLVAKGDKSVKNAEVCAVNGVPAEDLVVDPESKGVRFAIVYVPKPTAVKPEAESAAKSATIDFDQKGCMFIPHVLAVMKGATINVKSDDPIGHNVNSSLVNTKFNTNIQPGSAPYVVNPKTGENRPGKVVCDIHPWMSSWWLVSNSPYFAVTNEKGEYAIKDVPAGTQKVVVWQEAIAPQGYLTPGTGEAVTIKADDETTKDFTIQTAQIRK